MLAPSLSVSIAVKGIRGFVLTTDWRRGFLRGQYAATQNTISHTWLHTAEELIADSVSPAVTICQWIFERFGWIDAPAEVFKKDVVDFKSGVV